MTVIFILLMHPFAISGEQFSTGKTVILSEIAWMGTVDSANYEWIELYNYADYEVDLTEWTLKAEDGSPSISLNGKILPGGFFLLERTSDNTVIATSADMIYTGALGNEGEVLELKDASNTLVDTVVAPSGWPAGDNTTKATMERDVNGIWKTSLAQGGTPRFKNSVYDNSQDNSGGTQNDTDETLNNQNTTQEPESTGTKATTTPSSKNDSNVKIGDIVINEFVCDPSDTDTEWIELYNNSGRAFDLTGWTIEEGSGAKTSVSGTISAEGSARFFVVEKPKGNLNNDGDKMVLRDSAGALIDEIAYGKYADGDLNNNAPAVEDPGSCARLKDGGNTFNNRYDFRATLKPTKGASNIIIEEAVEDKEEIDSGTLAQYDFSYDILLTEIFPDPKGDDSKAEFVELYNNGPRDVDLSGWRIEDASGGKFEIKSVKSDSNTSGQEEGLTTTIIKTKGYFLLYRSLTNIALNNTGETVRLFQPLGVKPYKEAVLKNSFEDKSYNLIPGATGGAYTLAWQWSETRTPGKANMIKHENSLPEAVMHIPSTATAGIPILFDGSDSSDDDGDELSYSWDFGDGVKLALESGEHTYLKPGSYRVSLTISDGKGAVKKEKGIKVLDNNLTPTLSLKSRGGESMTGAGLVTTVKGNAKIIINEIMPSPAGSDEIGEWVEFKNPGKEKYDLKGWRVADSSAGAKGYKFEKTTWISAGGFYILPRTISKISLNNTSDEVRLFNSIGSLSDRRAYSGAKEGLSFIRRMDGSWTWSSKATPGKENETVLPAVKKTTASVKKAVKGKKITKSIETTLEKIREMEIGDKVSVTGKVAVLPGVLGTQYFYIVGSPGVQVYNFKKDFPRLAVGDTVKVTGEITESNGERRIKTSAGSDMSIVKRGDDLLPEKRRIDSFIEEKDVRFVEVSGEITKKSGATLYLDDGTEETTVYIKKYTGIKTGEYKQGDFIKVAGLFVSNKSGQKIFPRSQKDIARLDATQAAMFGVENPLKQEVNQDTRAKDKKIEYLWYSVIILLGVAGVFIAKSLQRKKED